jgi:hypothetical protein
LRVYFPNQLIQRAYDTNSVSAVASFVRKL